MKLLKVTGRMIALVLLIVVVLLLLFQSRLIYFPRPYGSETLAGVEQRKGRALEFTTSQGRQVAFYLPPGDHAGTEPVFLWIICGGNGSLALDYADEPIHWGAE